MGADRGLGLPAEWWADDGEGGASGGGGGGGGGAGAPRGAGFRLAAPGPDDDGGGAAGVGGPGGEAEAGGGGGLARGAGLEGKVDGGGGDWEELEWDLRGGVGASRVAARDAERRRLTRAAARARAANRGLESELEAVLEEETSELAGLRWALREEQQRLRETRSEATEAKAPTPPVAGAAAGVRARLRSPEPASPRERLAAALLAAEEQLHADEAARRKADREAAEAEAKAAAGARAREEAEERRREVEARLQEAEAKAKVRAAAEEAEAAAVAEAARKREQAQAREARVKAGEGGAGSDPDIWASAGALAWGVQCKETLKKVRDECKEILEAPLAVRKPLDKTLRKCVNSISATKQQVVQVYQRLSAALAAEQGPRQAYCLVRVCQLLVAQGEDLERQHQLAFPVGEVVAALGKDHPAVLSIFVGLLHEKASLAIPALRKDADEAELKAVASSQKGFFMLYGALVQSHVVPDNPHGAGFGWLYLARVLNGVPVSVASSTAIESFLRIAGYGLYCSFRRQFEKLMQCISAEVLPKMRSFHDKEHAAVISRLEQFISEKRYTSPPDGSDMPERDSSQEIRA